MSIEFPCKKCGKKYRVDAEKAGKTFRCRKCETSLTVPHPISRDTDEAEFTAGGSQLLRHQERKVPFEMSHGDEDSIEAISDHIEEHIGPVESVFHEIISDLVHIDVHLVIPTRKQPFYTLITSGMSEAPMTVPDGLEEFRFAELAIRLPKDWPMTQEDFEDENHYWPIRLLKMLARLPHEYDTWLGEGHTIPNGDPAEPYSPKTKLSCALVLPLIHAPDEFHRLELSEDKVINFYGVYPLYPQETAFKLNKGTDSLVELFMKHDISEVVDIRRKNVCKSSWWPFG